MPTRRTLLHAAAGLGVTLLPGAARANIYPSHTVRFVRWYLNWVGKPSRSYCIGIARLVH